MDERSHGCNVFECRPWRLCAWCAGAKAAREAFREAFRKATKKGKRSTRCASGEPERK